MHLMKKPLHILLVVPISFLFVFATPKKNSGDKKIASSVLNIKSKLTDAYALFSELRLDEAGMSQNAFLAALHGLQKLDEEGTITRSDIITIIDFSQPSNKRRLYVINLVRKRVLFNTLVAHGVNSGTMWANSFSNDPSSLMSSPGFYVTGETYFGEDGYSLRLDGMEKDINDNARSRAIVLHGASYVNQSIVKSSGFLGRSWGCPAVPLANHKAIINTIKKGTCLFIYTPDENYLQKSAVLNS